MIKGLKTKVCIYPIIILTVLLFQLEEVMETETYKNAKLILERFDPDSKKKMVSVPFL